MQICPKLAKTHPKLDKFSQTPHNNNNPKINNNPGQQVQTARHVRVLRQDPAARAQVRGRLLLQPLALADELDPARDGEGAAAAARAARRQLPRREEHLGVRHPRQEGRADRAHSRVVVGH